MSFLARRIVMADAALNDESAWTELRAPISWLSQAITGAIGSSTAAGKRVNADTAMRCTAVWRAVDLLSSLPAFLPLKVMRSRPEGGADVARDHNNFRLLYIQPNPWQTSYQWRQMLGLHLQLRGNAYSAIRFRKNGWPERLVPVHPDRVKVFVDDDGYPVYEVTPRKGDPVRLAHYEMHHLWLHSKDGYTGIGPIEANREGIGLALGAEEYGSRLLSNGGVLSGILKVPEGTNPEAKAAAKKSWQEGHRGLPNAHKVAVLEGDTDFKPISMSSVDAQWIEMRKFQVEEIARIFGIPPELLEHTSPVSSWGTGVEQRFLAFLATKLDPILVSWEQAMQLDFFADEELDVVYPQFNRSALLRTDILTRYRVHAISRQWGLSTANECRALEDQNPLPGDAGNTVLDPTNMDRLPADPTQALDQPTGELTPQVAQFVSKSIAQGADHA